MECPHCHTLLEGSPARCSSCGAALDPGAPAALDSGPRAENTYPAAEESKAIRGLFHAGSVVDGRYEVRDRIGRGGMGTVYRAYDRDLDETVALKVIHPSLIPDDATIIERFKHETRVARRLAHPNILKVYDLGSVGDVFYLSMEYLEGIDLKTEIQAHGPLAVGDVVEIACQVCAGLAYAHANGVIHRDIKPHNLFLLDAATRFASTLVDSDAAAARWVVKILDFGLAKAIDTKQLSSSGQMLGTPVYMSPEQANPRRGFAVDHRTDLYSLGVVLFQMCTGRVPFSGATPIETALMHLQDEPVRPAELRPGLPGHVEAVILKALAKDPDERYADARQIASDLRGNTRFFAEPTPLPASGSSSRARSIVTTSIPNEGSGGSSSAPGADSRALTLASPDDSGSNAAAPRRGSSRWSWVLALVLMVAGGTVAAWRVVLRPALIRMGYGDVLPGGAVGLPLVEARAQARKNLVAIAEALETRFSSGNFSYTDGKGVCPGSQTYSDDGTLIPDLAVTVQGGDFWYTIAATDSDGDGLCESFVLTAAGVRPPASQDTPLTLASDGTKTGAWQ